jgi:serum/glucocorticoid-regulated kinase 2
VDFYGMGALLYEMNFGFPPFYQQDSQKMFTDIVSQRLQFPDKKPISQELRSLLSILYLI